MNVSNSISSGIGWFEILFRRSEIRVDRDATSQKLSFQMND